MITINDALAREIIHASVSGGPAALSRYQSPSYASGMRAHTVARRKQSPSLRGGIHRLMETVRSALATSAPAPAPCCAPA